MDWGVLDPPEGILPGDFPGLKASHLEDVRRGRCRPRAFLAMSFFRQKGPLVPKRPRFSWRLCCRMSQCLLLVCTLSWHCLALLSAALLLAWAAVVGFWLHVHVGALAACLACPHRLASQLRPSLSLPLFSFSPPFLSLCRVFRLFAGTCCMPWHPRFASFRLASSGVSLSGFNSGLSPLGLGWLRWCVFRSLPGASRAVASPPVLRYQLLSLAPLVSRGAPLWVGWF